LLASDQRDQEKSFLPQTEENFSLQSAEVVLAGVMTLSDPSIGQRALPFPTPIEKKENCLLPRKVRNRKGRPTTISLHREKKGGQPAFLASPGGESFIFPAPERNSSEGETPPSPEREGGGFI